MLFDLDVVCLFSPSPPVMFTMPYCKSLISHFLPTSALLVLHSIWASDSDHSLYAVVANRWWSCRGRSRRRRCGCLRRSRGCACWCWAGTAQSAGSCLALTPWPPSSPRSPHPATGHLPPLPSCPWAPVSARLLHCHEVYRCWTCCCLQLHRSGLEVSAAIASEKRCAGWNKALHSS